MAMPFPFDNLLCMLLGISFTFCFTLLLVFIIVPAIFGLSFGIRRLYMTTLITVFESCVAACVWAYTVVGLCVCVCVAGVCVCVCLLCVCVCVQCVCVCVCVCVWVCV